MGFGPAWQPPMAAKSWPGVAGRGESNLRFEPAAEFATHAERQISPAPTSEVFAELCRLALAEQGVYRAGRRQVKGRNVHLVPHQPNHPDCKLPRQRRLKSSKLLQETFEQGRNFAGRLMVMWLREGNDASLRLGVAAGRTIGGAVQRNRAKRRLREAFRLNRHRLQGKCDIVLMARGRLNEAPWDEVQSELIQLADRAGILKKQQNEN